jgi:hypothetical protein
MDDSWQIADLNEQAENMSLVMLKKMAAREDVTEPFKAKDQMLWVQKMKNMWNRAIEIVNQDRFYT